MKTRKISQKRMTAFNKKVSELVERQFGGTLIKDRGDGAKKWSLQTKASELNISIHAPESSYLFSIFTCFEDVNKANVVLKEIGLGDNLNTFSGKFNLHISDEKVCLESFEIFLNKIT